MKLNLDYRFAKNDNPEKLSNIEVTSNYLKIAVASSYREGLEGQMRRVWGRIQRKLDEAVENKKNEIELEQAEKDFIKKVIDSAKFPAAFSMYIMLIEDEIESWKEKPKA